MKLIEPKVELWSELGVTPEQHIARCARVCYGNENKKHTQEQDKKLVDGLIKNGHISMLRNSSVYLYNTSNVRIKYEDYSNFITKVGTGWENTYGDEVWSINRETVFHANEDKNYNSNSIELSELLKKCQKYPVQFNAVRLTFCITTQISTSRELNRVSPNNIAERSTRFCSSKDGLVICKPWWWDVEDVAFSSNAEDAWNEAEIGYENLLSLGMKPEDARGVLPLDTATVVIYTYSVAEWKHILDLRLYDKTGKAHPNCHVVMQMVRDQINQFSKEHGIDYQV